MTKLIQTSTLAIASVFVLGATAFASDMPQDVTPVEMTQADVTAKVNDISSEVRGAVERGEYIAVEGPDGQIYYNRYIDFEDLPDPELDVRVVDTIEIEYEGEIYTNKIVQDAN